MDVPEMDNNRNARAPFIVRNGMLVSLGTPGGHLITDAVYKNYRLEVEYRFSAKPGNCGVLVHASTPRALYGMFPRSIEVQMQSREAGDFWCIVEDITVPDMEKRRGPKANWGTTGDKLRRIQNLTDGSEKPVGEWNTMVIETVGNTVKVWVNGTLVNYGYNATADKGQIALQAEGSEVEFRKLRLTPITKLTETAGETGGNDLAAQAPPSTDQSETTIGPTYMDAPEMTVRDDVPKGTIHEFVMKSTDSKIYPGIAKNQPGTVPYERKVAVYVPKQYVPGTPAPVLVVQDGMWYMNTVPKVLDNLIHQRRVPAMIAVLIHNGGGDAQGSQRGLEYDTVSETYATFIENEVLPKIAKDYNITFTKDPEGRATMGGSSGGAAAFTMAWFRPDLFRRVLTYSGTYVNQQSPRNPASPHGAWEYHEHFIPESPRKPLRIWLEVSENDNGSKLDEASLHNWVMANQRMAAALKAKGYAYRYVFAQAAGHTDGRVTRQTLPAALEWLWQGYPLAPAKPTK
jgi:enterochelin esterase-like enzyme